MNFDLNESGINYGLRLVFFEGKIKQIVIFCILGRTWDDWNKEMPEQERNIIFEIFNKNKMQIDYEHDWGRCYVFDDRKNSSCNLYIEYK